MKSLLLSAIRFYQRVLSPRKRFCCAYRSHTGHASCSALGYRAIRRFGAWRGLVLLNRRLEKCGIAYRRYHPAALRGQAGFCDVGGCDGPDIGDCLDGCGGCDWPNRKNRGRVREGKFIPPRRNTPPRHPPG